ncbi:hypothetical protein MHYP_G00273650 [Metynnis hypsauchen]
MSHPLITLMMSSNIPLVDSAFGQVQADAPWLGASPDGLIYDPSEYPPYGLLEVKWPNIRSYVDCHSQQQDKDILAPKHQHVYYWQIQGQLLISGLEWGQSSAESLAERILKGTHQTADVRRGLAVEVAVVEEYRSLRNLTFSPHGFLACPDAPWLGASPDGLIYGPSEYPPYGLLEVKCPNHCPYLVTEKDILTLKHQHVYYWQIQGQLLISGLEWCDVVVYTHDDMFNE